MTVRVISAKNDPRFVDSWDRGPDKQSFIVVGDGTDIKSVRDTQITPPVFELSAYSNTADGAKEGLRHAIRERASVLAQIADKVFSKDCTLRIVVHTDATVLETGELSRPFYAYCNMSMAMTLANEDLDAREASNYRDGFVATALPEIIDEDVISEANVIFQVVGQKGGPAN